MNEKSILISLCWAFGLTTLGLFAGAVRSFFFARRFLSEASRTEGIVVENAVTKNSDGGATYVPIVFFQSKNQQHVLQGRTATNPPIYRVGDRIGVCYAPENPQNAKIYSVWEIYHNCWLFLFFGSAGLITAFVLYYAAQH